MLTFDTLYSMGHEQVLFLSDSSCGLRAIVAIHDTTLGPALGGTRMWPYASEQEAIEDVLRLSRGMTYKAAISGLNLGGGKAVIIGDPQKHKSEALFRSYGQFIESLNGRYITAEDVNIRVEDIEHIFTETSYVVGVAQIHGGSGNPSPYTALGVLRGMQAACLRTFGSKDLKNKVVAIQGVGSVGHHLGEYLAHEGAKIYYADVNPHHLSLFKEKIPQAIEVSPREIHQIPCDIFAPCALGAILNDYTIPELKCKIVAGAANNQLRDTSHGKELKKRSILYVPDYLINAGGLMNVSIEFEGWNDAKAKRMVDTIYETSLRIFDLSDKENKTTNEAADLIAEKRIKDIRQIKGSFLGQAKHRFPGRKKRFE